MGRYGNDDIEVHPNEKARRTKENALHVISFKAIENTIILQPSTISALKELAFSEPKIRNNSYDEIILMLIKTYRQAQRAQQWRHDHPNYDSKAHYVD